jgi:hypothetical protein
MGTDLGVPVVGTVTIILFGHHHIFTILVLIETRVAMNI